MFTSIFLVKLKLFSLSKLLECCECFVPNKCSVGPDPQFTDKNISSYYCFVLSKGKRSLNQLRIGKRSLQQLRLGKKSGMEQLRIGKRALDQLRIGKRALDQLRIGKREDEEYVDE